MAANGATVTTIPAGALVPLSVNGATNYITPANLYNAMKSGTTTTAPTGTLTVATPTAKTTGTAFAVTGTYANVTPTALDMSLNGGSTWTAINSPTISGGNYSFTLTITTANASQTIKVRDHNNTGVVATSGAFAVTAPATGGTKTESASGTQLTGTTGTIYDAALHAFTLVAAPSPQTGLGVAYDGMYQSPSQNVNLGLYWNHVFYQRNTAGAYYKWNGTGYDAVTADPRQSADKAQITATGTALYDATGTKFTLVTAVSPQTGLGVAVNDAYVSPTSNVVLVEYWGGKIYQKNSAGAFYMWNGTAFVTSSDPSVAPTVVRARGVAMINLGNGDPNSQYFSSPSDSHLDYYNGKGVKFSRLELLWERMQRTLNGPLDTDYVAMVQDTLDRMASRGMYCMLDIHNYCVYAVGSVRGGAAGTRYQLGSSQVPNSALYDLWNKMVTKWKDHPAVFGWGLMNEPTFDQPKTNWYAVAQQLVTNIRAIESKKFIAVGLWGYSNINSVGSGENNSLDINDPAGRILYEIHGGVEADALDTYLLGAGANGSQGTGDFDYYTNSGPTDSYSGLRMGTALNQSRVDRVVAWVNSRTYKPYGIFWGECGVPTYDRGQPSSTTGGRWVPLMQDFYNRMPANWSFTWWMDGAGTFDDDLKNSSCGPINQGKPNSSCQEPGTYTDRACMPMIQSQAALSNWTPSF